jgi:hypothetical protein
MNGDNMNASKCKFNYHILAEQILISEILLRMRTVAYY